MPPSTTRAPRRQTAATSRNTRGRTGTSTSCPRGTAAPQATSSNPSIGNADSGSTGPRRPVRIVVVNRPVWPSTYSGPRPTSTSSQDKTSNDDDDNGNEDDDAPHIVVPNITAETMDFAARMRANRRHIGEIYINNVRMPPDHPQNSVPANITHNHGGNQPVTVDASGNVVYEGHSLPSAPLTHEENGVITIEITPERMDDYLLGDALAEHGLATQGWEFHIYDDTGTFVHDGRRIMRTDTHEGRVPMDFTFFGRSRLQVPPREVIDLTQDDGNSGSNQRREQEEDEDSDEVHDPQQYDRLASMVAQARELAARLEAEGSRAPQ